MNKEYTVAIISIVILGMLSIAAYDISTHVSKSTSVFSSADITGSSDLQSQWIKTDSYLYHTIFIHFKTDSTYYVKAIDDSLNADLVIELSNNTNISNASAYWLHGESAAYTIATFTIADTVNSGRWYINMNNLNDAFTNARLIRFRLEKNTGHVLGNRNFTWDVNLVQQP